MPSKRPSSSKATALTSRPSSRARRTSSVRYSSPVVGDGVERPDPAAQPGGIEGVQAGVDLVARELVLGRVLGLDDRLDGAELAAHDAPELGRVGGEDGGQRDRRVVLAARLEDRLEVGGRDERHVAGEDEDLGRVVGDRGSAPARTASPVPRGSSWSANVGSVGERVADGRDGRRVDDDRAAAGPPLAACSSQASRTYASIGRPHSGCRTLGSADRMRVPRPAARTTAVVRPACPGHGLGTWRVHARRRACTGRSCPRCMRCPTGGRGVSSVGRRMVWAGPPGPSSVGPAPSFAGGSLIGAVDSARWRSQFAGAPSHRRGGTHLRMGPRRARRRPAARADRTSRG